MPRRPNPYQLDLFAGSHGVQIAQPPLWQALPAETRRVLTRLMVQLIFDYADRGHTPGRDDGHHDV